MERPAPAIAARNDSARSALLIRMGQASEKDGRIPQALGHYREIVEKYPGSLEAGTAAARLESLGQETAKPPATNENGPRVRVEAAVPATAVR
jgi:predicted TPR repeat methyltransferase